MGLELDVGVASRNFRHSTNEDNYFVFREQDNMFSAEFLRFIDFVNKRLSKKELEKLRGLQDSDKLHVISESPDGILMIYREHIPVEKNEFSLNNRLFCVLDGVSGRSNPYSENHVCSVPAICTTKAVELVPKLFYRRHNPDFDNILRKIDSRIVKEIKWYKKKTKGLNLTSSAVGTFALVQPGRLTVKHFGDTKLFVKRGQKLEQVTEDQTLGISPHTYLGHGYVQPVTFERNLQPGDLILVCSDGLIDPYLSIGLGKRQDSSLEFVKTYDRFSSFIDSEKSAQEICDVLVRQCEEHYRQKPRTGDDATAVVVRYL